MNIKFSFFFVLVCFFYTSNAKGQITKSAIKSAKLVGQVDHNGDYPYETTLHHIGGIHSHDNKKYEHVENFVQTNLVLNPNSNNKKTAIAPIILNNFEGNPDNGFTPPDNTVAVSNGGIVVSAINSNLYYYNLDGDFIGQSTFLKLIRSEFPTYQGKLYDPRLIYDPNEDRFILVFLHGSSPDESNVMVMFSVSNNPVDGWNLYDLPGNPFNKDQWTDYPNISINDNDLFISGNLFDANNSFDESYIIQIGKKDGFDGKNISYQNYSGFKDVLDKTCFTLVPAIKAKGGGSYNKMYFLSTSSNSGKYIAAHTITGSISENNTNITVNHILVNDYSRGLNSPQKGNSDLLNSGDSRMHSVIIMNNELHAAHTTRLTNGNCAIAYYKISINDWSAKSIVIGENQAYLAFPSLGCPYNSYNKNSIILSYVRSNSTIFPEARMVHIDEDFSVSSDVLLKEGLGSVDVLSDDIERWGDYTCLAKQYNSNTLWSFTSVGNTDGQWLNQLSQVSLDKQASVPTSSTSTNLNVYPNPIAERFTLDFSVSNREKVEIKLYSSNGQLIEVLFNDTVKPGSKQLSFNVSHLKNGHYLVKVSSASNSNLKAKSLVINH